MRANPFLLFKKEREYLIIIEILLKHNEGLSYKYLSVYLKDYNLSYLRDKLRLLISIDIIKVRGVYNKILYIENDKKELLKKYVDINKEFLKVFSNENFKSISIEREKNRKMIL